MKKIYVSILILIIGTSVFAIGKVEEPPEELPHFVIGFDSVPDSVPLTGALGFYLGFALFEGLVTWNPQTLEAVPGVAESWEISGDGLTYTFKLRRNAVWSDGTPVTADQFIDAWLHILDPETQNREEFSLFVFKGAEEFRTGEAGPEDVAIRALDEHTLQFELVDPVPYALFILGFKDFGPLPTHIIEKYGDQWTDPEVFVGNGPFVVAQWLPGNRAVFRKSDNYWDRDSVRLGRVTILQIEDPDTALDMFQAGEIDMTSMIVPYDQLVDLLSAPYIQLYPLFQTEYYYLNMKSPPLDDVRVRKALTISINRAELIEKALGGLGYPAFGLSPPMPFYPAVIGFEENTEKARSHLSEAGYPQGEGFPEITLIYNDNRQKNIRTAEYIEQQWAENLGIVVNRQGMSWDDYRNAKGTGDFGIARYGWWGHYLDPNCFLELFTGGYEKNPSGFSNSEYDGLLERASRMPAGQERLDLLRKAEEILINDEMVIIPLYYYMYEQCIDTEIWGGWYGNVMHVHPWKWIYRK